MKRALLMTAASLMLASTSLASESTQYSAEFEGDAFTVTVTDTKVIFSDPRGDEEFFIKGKTKGALLAESSDPDSFRVQIFTGEGLEAFCEVIADPETRKNFQSAPESCDADTKAALVLVPRQIGNNRVGMLLK